MLDFYNLERARKLLMIKSTSDYVQSKGTGDKLNYEDGCGCLSHVTRYSDNLTSKLANVYCQQKAITTLTDDVLALISDKYKSGHSRKKYSKKAAYLILYLMFVKDDLKDCDKAKELGVLKQNYKEHHEKIINDACRELQEKLAVADSLAWEYWHGYRLTD